MWSGAYVDNTAEASETARKMGRMPPGFTVPGNSTGLWVLSQNDWVQPRVWVEPCTGDRKSEKALDSLQGTALTTGTEVDFLPVSNYQKSVCPKVIIL